ncbi:MAG TPA: hypothetical protein ENH00_06395 [Actinobacteria bacterium]|nr:hypothetical protein BMS3Bbin01_02060 [bacterium BMS3Bbin01]HDH25809.1 hypothetical protein [Actinomycetota bacterium]
MVDSEPRVQIFRELTIQDAASYFDALGAAIEQALADPWSRDHGREAELNESSSTRYLAFRRAGDEVMPGATLYLSPRDSDVYVPNIVPTDIHSLDMEQYNSLLIEFADRTDEAVAGLGLELDVGSDQADLSSELDPDVYSALKLFSRTSNRSTGSSHPSDRDKWMEFICALVDSGYSLSPGLLQEWLVADGWPEETAFDLILQFEFGVAILRHANQR